MNKNERPHIGIFGRRNNGKSSFINAISNQEISIVSDYAGTTTDPVNKAIELTGIGPVVLIDTPGIDDTGELGQKRIEKTLKSIKIIDMAILMISSNEFGDPEKQLINEFVEHNVPFFIVHNKSDIHKSDKETEDLINNEIKADIIDFSALLKNKDEIELIIDLIRKYMPDSVFDSPTIVGDLVSYGDIVLLITPIDVQAPKGRLILPQVQVIRDLLDNDCVTIVLKEREVDSFLRNTGIKPKLAITDSQVFLKADASIPPSIPLTSFSILFARYKGEFNKYIEGTPHISELKDGDNVLILESCSHHVAGDDIGRVKIPRWISNFTGKQLNYDVAAGFDSTPRDIKDYSLVIQCGGCMLSRKQIVNRLKPFIDAGIPVTNYGMSIAYVQGIYKRAVAPFTGVHDTDYL